MNIKDVENLAELAKLELSADEKESLLHDMEGILGYVKQIEAVEVPARNAFSIADAGGGDVYNVWREDRVEPREFSADLIKEQFPDAQDGFLKVKKIL